MLLATSWTLHRGVSHVSRVIHSWGDTIEPGAPYRSCPVLEKLHPGPLCILSAEENWVFVLFPSTLKTAASFGH